MPHSSTQPYPAQLPEDYRVHAQRLLSPGEGPRNGDMVSMAREGLSAESVTRVATRYAVADDIIAHVMEISRSTLQRRKQSGRFLPGESDRFIRLTGLYAMAENVFESPAQATRWMTQPNRSLGGETPLAYADTQAGAREVEDVLGRIAHGVAA